MPDAQGGGPQPFSRKYWLPILVLLLFVLNFFLFQADRKTERVELIFAMLDVGQGDAIFIESATGTQILIDSGPPRRVMRELALVMSPFDKFLDAIIITHPDQDHIGGFAEVLDVYEVGLVLEPGTIHDSKTFQNLKTEIKNKNIPNILARAGMRLDIGGGAVIDILFPDRDVFDWALNEASVVARLHYGNMSVMLMGDATVATEEIVLNGSRAAKLPSTVLKVGHHGSRTSTAASFVQKVSPSYAIISAGEDNNFGHPHPDVLSTLEDFGAKVLRTDLLGTIVMKSDGENISFSFGK